MKTKLVEGTFGAIYNNERVLMDRIVDKAINWEQNRSPFEEEELAKAVQTYLKSQANGFTKIVECTNAGTYPQGKDWV